MQNIQKILDLLSEDQKNIKRFKKGEISFEVFGENAERLGDQFFDLYQAFGFPYKNEVGEEVYQAAVTLALHQPTENLEIIFRDLQNRNEDEVHPKDRAYMADKICVHKGEAQVYGTQYKIQEGKVVFLPIKNESEVNERRRQVGMELLEEYRKKAENSLVS
ncbi:MAG TPA: DUF6624 domain-containing protein [Candidatus Paceibacterota bacterium]|nr:DUF6624 domain-containing protein [Candidatus Paceibacterota bacterium]